MAQRRLSMPVSPPLRGVLTCTGNLMLPIMDGKGSVTIWSDGFASLTPLTVQEALSRLTEPTAIYPGQSVTFRF